MKKLILISTITLLIFSCQKLEDIKENTVIEETVIKKTIEGNKTIYQATQGDVIISELSIEDLGNGQSSVVAGFDNSAANIKNVYFNNLDENGLVTASFPLIKNNQNVVAKEEWIWVVAAIIVWCVDGNVSWSQSSGWSGSIGFDCYAIAPPNNDFPKNYTERFSIKAIN